jgi:Peptidase A4 family
MWKYLEAAQHADSSRLSRRFGPISMLWCILSVLPPLVSFTTPVSASPVPEEAIVTHNWSGYALIGSSFTGITGTFNIPYPLKSASCLEETSIWVGVDGMYSHDLLQAGIAETGFTLPSSGLRTEWPAPTVAPILCGRKGQTYAWWEDLPSAPVRANVPVDIGDEVTVSIFKISPGWWALAVHDTTDKRSFLMTEPYGGPQTSVDWVVEAPQVLGIMTAPVPFSTVDFRDLDADGLARHVERFSFGSHNGFASPSDPVGNAGRLMRIGFTVHWASADDYPHR